MGAKVEATPVRDRRTGFGFETAKLFCSPGRPAAPDSFISVGPVNESPSEKARPTTRPPREVLVRRPPINPRRSLRHTQAGVAVCDQPLQVAFPNRLANSCRVTMSPFAIGPKT